MLSEASLFVCSYFWKACYYMTISHGAHALHSSIIQHNYVPYVIKHLLLCCFLLCSRKDLEKLITDVICEACVSTFRALLFPRSTAQRNCVGRAAALL